MTIFDGILILTVLGCLLALVSLGYFLFRRQWRQATRVLLALASLLVLYVVILTSVSLFSPQHVLAMHQDRCFDDWCLSVERIQQQATVGSSPQLVTAHGIFYLVTVRISSQAKAVSQRALDVQIYLLNGKGQRYNPDPSGQQALNMAGRGGQPLNSELTPGASFLHTVVFDLPPDASHLGLVVTHGLFPDVLIIGSDQSFFHQPTIIQISS